MATKIRVTQQVVEALNKRPRRAARVTQQVVEVLYVRAKPPPTTKPRRQQFVISS